MATGMMEAFVNRADRRNWRWRVISHRALLRGPDPKLENRPEQVDRALRAGFDVELDLWYIEGEDGNDSLWLGHDRCQYPTSVEWLAERADRLWIHCKDVETFEFMTTLKLRGDFNFFYHTHEAVVLTSKGVPWSEPGERLLKTGVCVLPEMTGQDPAGAWGVCTDYPYRYVEGVSA
jgi:hypothetical protein